MISGRKVRCRTCGCTDMYETSEHYDPDTPLTGDQLQLQQPFRSYNWPTYEGALPTKETSRFRMFCVRCMGHVSTTGELHFVDPGMDTVPESIPEPISDEPREVLTLTPEPEATYKQKMAQMRHKPKRKKK
ncbi:MAG: hypothetical protein BA863_03590 [Desulfovibrio sp. S3730MH75]|nr:MAG: hypothetical protein BA863_03590 [Desulfovibrio sp. S3730MH75]